MADRHVPIAHEADIVTARRQARELAIELGFDVLGQVRIATAVSELARNIIQYAGNGEITLSVAHDERRRGLALICSDQGPGIANLDLVLAGGISPVRGRGRGLTGARALLDEFRIETVPGRGTTIWGCKWLT